MPCRPRLEYPNLIIITILLYQHITYTIQMLFYVKKKKTNFKYSLRKTIVNITKKIYIKSLLKYIQYTKLQKLVMLRENARTINSIRSRYTRIFNFSTIIINNRMTK